MRVRRLAGVVGVVLVWAAFVVVAVPGAARADAGSFRFSSDVVDANEAQGLVRITVERTDLPVSRTSVGYRTRPGAATEGVDFEATRGSLIFDVGETSASFLVVIRDDTVVEPVEDLATVLESGSTPVASAAVRILDDDVNRRPVAATSSFPSSSSSSSSSSSGGGGGGSSTPPTSVAAPVVAAPVAAPVGRVAGRPRTTARAGGANRRVTVRQSPVTPFELRPAAPMDADQGPPAAVDPILAVVAALLVGRVAAEVWFRLRLGPA